jgi:hypothetical protein
MRYDTAFHLPERVHCCLHPATQSTVAALFNADVSPPATTHGKIHFYDAMVNFTSLTVASILISLGSRWDERWRSYYKLALALGLGLFVAFIGQLVSVQYDTRGEPFAGLVNRAFCALNVNCRTMSIGERN